MPNFNATLRLDYRDVSGLVLSCTREDIIEDTLHAGFARGWRNRAVGLPSLPEFRQVYEAFTQRGNLGQPEQNVQARQPSIASGIGGVRRLRFTQADQTFLRIPTPSPVLSEAGATFAFQFEPAAGSGNQVIYDDQSQIMLSRVRAGSAQFDFDATSGVLGADLPAGRWMINSTGAEVEWARDRTLDNGSQAGVSNVVIGDSVVYIGRSAAGEYLDGYLDSFHLWARDLSPLEKDFVWQTLDQDGVSYHAETRADISSRIFTDITGTPGTNQINRVRSPVSMNQKFKLVTVPAGVGQRVQIAASVEGVVKPDADLTELFNLRWVELPAGAGVPPAVYRDTGWSSVFDCKVKAPGHYCAQVWRNLGGSMYLHFDVQEEA